MGLNFRIIDGETNPHKDIYEDFKKDYLDENITKGEMLKKYGLNSNAYRHLKDRVMEETGVNRKVSRVRYTNAWANYSRYIDYMKKSDKYRVSKMIMGKKHHFGLYKDLETAEYVRDRLEANDWSQDEYKQIRFELFGEEEEPVNVERIYDDFKEDFVRGESIKYIKGKYRIGNNTYIITKNG